MAGKTSRKGKGHFAAYKSLDLCKKNRAKNLAKHLKEQPNDKQAVDAVKASRGYVRTGGNSKRWSPEGRWMAQIERTLKGFWKQVYNSNGKYPLPHPQPEFVTFGDRVETPIKDQKPVKKSRGKNGKQ